MANRALVITIGILGIFYMLALVAIFIRYKGDDKSLAIGALSIAAGSIVSALLTLKQSADNGVAIKEAKAQVAENTALTAETHQAVNGRMDELIATVKSLAAAQQLIAVQRAVGTGIAIGREREQASQAVQATQTGDTP